MAAGSETTAKILSIIWYHLLDVPRRLEKVRSEIETLPVEASWEGFQRLDYLSAVVNEGLRLDFGITGRTQVCLCVDKLETNVLRHRSVLLQMRIYAMGNGRFLPELLSA